MPLKSVQRQRLLNARVMGMLLQEGKPGENPSDPAPFPFILSVIVRRAMRPCAAAHHGLRYLDRPAFIPMLLQAPRSRP